MGHQYIWGYMGLIRALQSPNNVCVMATAFFFNAVANVSAIAVQNRNDVVAFVLRFLLAFLCSYLGFALIAIVPAIYAVATPLLFLLAAVVGYLTSTYDVHVNINTVAFVFESNPHEAADYIGARFILWLLLSQLAAAGSILAYRRTRTRRMRPRVLVLAALLPVIPVAALSGPPGADFVPLNAVVQTRNYFVERGRIAAAALGKVDIAPRFRYAGDDELTVIVIVGESARADHFHINGYPRQTSPRLESLGVISYRDVWSCDSVTRNSVPCLFRREAPGETSLIAVFRHLGFQTAWISNQGHFDLGATAITSVASEAQSVVYANRSGTTLGTIVHDEQLLPDLDAALADPAPRKLVALHTVGSHWFYESHYPDAFRRWKPVCAVKAPAVCGEGLINSYDNAILHTDHLIAEVIARVEARNALVLYTSDHGESLGEDGVYLHTAGSERREQRQVPFFVWVSPEFARRHPAEAAQLAADPARPITHHHLFHTVLDCAGAASELIDPRLSLCRAAPPPERRARRDAPRR